MLIVMYIALVFLCCVLEAALSAHNIFPFLSKWTSGGSDRKNLNKLVNICGGADSKDKDSKIKGVCIGIDLGTTYR